MARKKQEIQLQQEIETQEEWEEMIAKEGLFVVDVYQEWCGPCTAMVSNFRRIKNELGDDLLHFAIAKADTIDALDKYKGKCEPTFLYFAGGVLVAVVHGSQSPLIMRTITEQLAQEHKVIEGNAERKEIKDPMISSDDVEKGELDEDETEKDEPKGFTVAIIKPDAVRNNKVDEILEQMRDKGIEILTEEERQLTEDEAREFYSHLKDEEYFEDLVQFMSSGPSHVLVLTKGSTDDDAVLTEWRDMIGPTSTEEAKEQAPESLRAKYGSGGVMNALHGSSSPETAAREMAFFFPKLTASKSKTKGSKLERTLALIRPDAFRTNKDAILAKIRESGFKVALQKTMTLTKEQAADFYKEHKDQPYFDDLITRMSSGPLLALGLAREDAISGWRQMLGPKEVNVAKEEAPDSLRAQFAIDDVEINQLHGSDSSETAKKELEFFFPMEQTVACIKPDGIGTKDAIIDKIHEAGFRIAAQKETVITKDIAENFYAEHKDKEYFNDLVQHMTSGPTMFMVLSREDAVSGWRETIGPTDPNKAKEEIPESLRAMFGKDILQNAVHGSSNSEHALKSIEQVFGHMEFNSDESKETQQQQETTQERTSDGGTAESVVEGETQEGGTSEQVTEQGTESGAAEQTTTEGATEEQGTEQTTEGQTTETTQESTEANQSQTPEEGQTDQSNDAKPDDAEVSASQSAVNNSETTQGEEAKDDAQTESTDKGEGGAIKIESNPEQSTEDKPKNESEA